jgi:transcription termination/antitermination protein NusA
LLVAAKCVVVSKKNNLSSHTHSEVEESVSGIYQAIDILSKEKGISRDIVVDAVKDAMIIAARKHYRTNEDLDAEFDQKSGEITLFGLRQVVEQVADPQHEVSLAEAQKADPTLEIGSTLRTKKPKPAAELGRIAAQMVKQVLLQKVREAERENVYSEFADRMGELVTVTIKRLEPTGDIVVDMQKTEARMPKKEQSRLESFSVGERARAVIKTVEKAGKNSGVIVSRGDAMLVQRLFEQEVPEIYDHTVVIKACAREAGERTKIAVWSRDRDVDCVGACVGMKGMRVQSIIRELRGEKIDIIEYSDDPSVFAQHALSPAKISRVNILSVEGKHMEVIVDDSQLSLAIGKKGQNVRLAAKLLGWKVDIKSEEEKRQEAQSMGGLSLAGTPVSSLMDHGLPEDVVDRLVAAGIGSVEKVGSMTPEELEAIEGVGPETVDLIAASVGSFYGVPPLAPVAAPEAVAPEAVALELAAEEPVAAGEPIAVSSADTEKAVEDAETGSDTIIKAE